jgi:hypothetical protein
MPVTPLDLQTLFSHINQVGKEQAAQKEGTAIQQSMQAHSIVKQTQVKDKTVNEAKEPDTGPAKVKDENKGRQNPAKQGEEKKEDEKKGGDAKREVVKDPALGIHIDISG